MLPVVCARPPLPEALDYPVPSPAVQVTTVTVSSWDGIDPICAPGCIASESIAIDSNGNFCDRLWTPLAGTNGYHDIILDVNGNGIYDEGTDFVDAYNFTEECSIDVNFYTEPC